MQKELGESFLERKKVTSESRIVFETIKRKMTNWHFERSLIKPGIILNFFSIDSDFYRKWN